MRKDESSVLTMKDKISVLMREDVRIALIR